MFGIFLVVGIILGLYVGFTKGVQPKSNYVGVAASYAVCGIMNVYRQKK